MIQFVVRIFFRWVEVNHQLVQIVETPTPTKKKKPLCLGYHSPKANGWNHQLLLMENILHHLGCFWNPVNNAIKYQTQLVGRISEPFNSIT